MLRENICKIPITKATERAVILPTDYTALMKIEGNETIYGTNAVVVYLQSRF